VLDTHDTLMLRGPLNQERTRLRKLLKAATADAKDAAIRTQRQHVLERLAELENAENAITDKFNNLNGNTRPTGVSAGADACLTGGGGGSFFFKVRGIDRRLAGIFEASFCPDLLLLGFYVFARPPYPSGAPDA
jgi:hypothetical protein